jgi:hypothetical protein
MPFIVDLMDKIPFHNEFNEVAGGGWQYVLFYSTIATEKSLQYFYGNMHSISKTIYKQHQFSDVSINCELTL